MSCGHTFVSVAKTLPAGEVKDIIGHSQNMDTFGQYGHALTGDAQRAAQAVNAAFAQLLTKDLPGVCLTHFLTHFPP